LLAEGLVNDSLTVVIQFNGMVGTDMQASAATVAGIVVNRELDGRDLLAGGKEDKQADQEDEKDKLSFLHLGLLIAW